MSIVEFLEVRIAEDEDDPWRGAELIGADRIVGRAEADALHAESDEWEARVLAECAAKRQVVRLQADLLASWSAIHEGDPKQAMWPDVNRRERHQALVILEQLAAVHADHPDYDEAWRP